MLNETSSCVHELFEAQVLKTPDSPAVVCDDQMLSYREVNEKANQLAHALIEIGVSGNDRIALCCERSTLLIVALLAIQKSGGAYVPLDPEYPEDRLHYMLQDCGAKILLCQNKLSERFSGMQGIEEITQFLISGDSEVFTASERNNPKGRVTPDNYIYAIYTSGSTGQPKGSLVYHRGAHNLLNWYCRELAFDQDSRPLLMTSLSFDLTQKNIYAPLISGGCLYLLHTQHYDASIILNTIERFEITSINCTPSAFSGLAVDSSESQLKKLASLKYVVLGGEPILVNRFWDWLNSDYCQATIINSYGPTECTDVVAAYRLQDFEAYREGSVPIGFPVDNTELFVMDGELSECPVGVEGELYIGGAGVGAGYLNRPDLTAEKFVAHPQREDLTIYGTGDRVRMLDSGALDYIGRIDLQVKVRGFRIELGEIEAKLEAIDGLQEAVVLARPDANGENRLVAYLKANATSDPVNVSEIRATLQHDLPDFMLPTAWVFMQEMPLNPNGKLDRKALPDPGQQRPTLDQPYVRPKTQLEEYLAEQWIHLLNLDRVGVKDRFFELGGTSIRAIQFIAQLSKELGESVQIADFFESPSIEGLIATLENQYRDALLKRFPQHKERQPTGSSDERKRPMLSTTASGSDPIAIIGMAGRFPGADSIQEFWRNLCDGVEAFEIVSKSDLVASGLDPSLIESDDYVAVAAPLNEVESFDATFFGYSPKEIEIMDPQHRIILEAAWSAMEDAGYEPDNAPGITGVFCGVARDGYLINNIVAHPEMRRDSASYHTMIGNEKDFPATRVSYKLNLTGPGINVQTACSSSGVATHLAVESLRKGECDMALVGGCRVMVPNRAGYLYVDGGTLSEDGHIHAFDHRACGMVRGSGVGMVVLKRLSEAQRDGDHIYALIKGTAINNDGAEKLGFTAPAVLGQKRVIEDALDDAKVSADSISYVEAHGTGTQLGDPIEVAALTQAFRRDTQRSGFCRLGSVKTNIGHLDAGSAVAGMIKSALALKHKTIPASLGYEKPNPKIDFDASPFFVNHQLSDWLAGDTPRRAGVSSFGLGGTNTHIVLQEAPESEASSDSRHWQLLLLSGRNEEALQAQRNNLGRYLATSESPVLADIAFTLQTGRKAFEQRFALVCQSAEQAVDELTKSISKQSMIDSVLPSVDKVVFLFPGQGAQYVNMALDLYENEPLFRETVDQCCDILIPLIGEDLRSVLYPKAGDESEAVQKLNDTALTQPALFVIEYSLAKLWMFWGITPDLLIGHSIGEFVAACLAGVFSQEDALRVVAERGRLMSAMPQGSMLAVRLSEEDLLPKISEEVVIATINGPQLCVISGPDEAVAANAVALEAEGVDTIPIHTSHAFHSTMMTPAVEPFLRVVETSPLALAEIPIISTLSGCQEAPESFIKADYWARQLAEPVRFSQAIESVLEDSDASVIFLEVGPGSNLSSNIRQHALDKSRHRVISSLGSVKDETPASATFLLALGQLWAAGLTVDWQSFYETETRKRTSLPTYPFQRKRFWIDPPPFDLDQAPAPIRHIVDNAVTEPVTLQATQPEIKQPTMSKNELITNRLSSMFYDLSGIEIGEDALDNGFLEMGLDSLFLTQVSGELKSEFGVTVRFRELMEDLNSLSRLAAHLEEILPDSDFPELSEVVVASPAEASINAASLVDAQQAGANLQQMVSNFAAGSSSGMEAVISQQLQLMARQLDILTGGGVNPQPVMAANVAKPQKSIGAEKPAVTQTEADKKPFGAAVRIETNNSEFTESQKTFLQEFIAQYNGMTAKSKAFAEQNRSHLADPRVVSGFNPTLKETVYPIVVERSKGSRFWDIDGNEFIDVTCGFGTNLIGHTPDLVIEAVEQQLHKGIEIGPQTPLVAETSKLLCDMTGSERAIFCNTGSEAVMGAMRLARTVTGRKLVVAFRNDYHGIFDEVIVRGTPNLRSVPAATGINPSAVENMLILDYGSEESLQVIREHASELAALLVEPVQSRNLNLQPREFMHELRAIADESDIALIFDEVITGFRSHIGGAQAYFGVKADIATYGKIIGGGLPIGAIAGRSKYMDALDGGHWQFGDNSVPEVGVTYFAGTFVRHPLAMAASRAMLTYLKAQGGVLQEELTRRTTEFLSRLQAEIDRLGVALDILHFSSAFQLHFPDDAPLSGLFYALMRQRNVHIFQGRTWFFTTAHTDEDMDRILIAIKESLEIMLEYGFLSGNETSDANARNHMFEQYLTPPVAGARLGRTITGMPAWFVDDPDEAGSYLIVE